MEKRVGKYNGQWVGMLACIAAGFLASQALASEVVFFGDSVTEGYGLEASQDYPAVLQKKIQETGLPYMIVNAGTDGMTTRGGIQEVENTVPSGKSILVIALGANDALQKLPVSQIEANLGEIIERARRKSPEVVILLAGLHSPSAYYVSYGKQYAEDLAAVFPRVAKHYGVILIPYLFEGVGGVRSLNQADGIHPTAEGQRKIAENVWSVLKPVLIAQKGK
ncbi:MAG: arylesterase [Chthoniobacterales bacterium]